MPVWVYGGGLRLGRSTADMEHPRADSERGGDGDAGGDGMNLKDLISDVNVNEIYEHIETETLSEWVNAWQKAALSTLTPPNEPLTLKELREMDDEPVWCCPKNDSAKGSWMIVGPNGCENITSFAIYDDYGTGWLAYRRPPEVSP